MIYAEVAVNTAVDQSFHYHVPVMVMDLVQVGSLIRVSFGTAMQPGIVIALSEHSPVQQTKPILEVYDPEPVVTDKQIALARWLSAQYLCPLGLCLWLFLPPGIVGKRDQRVELLREDLSGDNATETALIDLLKRRGALTGTQINRALKRQNWRGAVKSLKARGGLYTRSILLPPRAKPRKIQVAALTIDPAHLPHVRGRLGKPSRTSDLLTILLDMDAETILVLDVLALPGVGNATLGQVIDSGAARLVDGTTLELTARAEDALFDLRGGEQDEAILRVLAREDEPIDVSWVYAQTGAKLDDLKRLETYGLITLGEKETIRDSLADRSFMPMLPPQLTAGQREAWAAVKAAPMGSTVLLHGVTGSGKTEIYLRAIQRTLAEGRSALFLVPEIALTPQTIRRVMARFSEKTAVVHSRLSEGERYDTWRRARAGELNVIIGTRSALFAPLPDVGLIILDEAHDQSYKQSPPVAAPYYDAWAVAKEMAAQNQAVVILGSATPDIETYFQAQEGTIHYVPLPDRIMGHRVRVMEQADKRQVKTRYRIETNNTADAMALPLPDVHVVDMRDELKAGNVTMFSHELHAALSDVLAQGQQAILFLNRRGTSTYVFCRDCGAVAQCPRCDTPLTDHHHAETLQCHHCGFTTPTPQQCVKCGSKRIKFFGAGTQQVEEAFKAAFPDSIALRWDADSTRQAGQHDLILERFMAQQADVLIGTQMVAKGLDLPLVTLVGVISADTGLNLPDFRTGERTFQVLTQVAGRAGRGLLGGRVVLQTYQPEHIAIQAAANHDYKMFYEAEIQQRYALGYPPYRRLARIVFRDANERRAQDAAEQCAAALNAHMERTNSTHVALIGPVPCFFTRRNRLYRWHILIRAPDPAHFLAGVDLPHDAIVDVDPVDML
jgi:primosomal protein N' (replication factor Y) (superfamily II helicase)